MPLWPGDLKPGAERRHAPQALETLIQIMGSPKAASAARIAAANAILDRGFGKPVPVVSELTPADVRTLSDAELTAIIRGDLAELTALGPWVD